MSASIHSLAVQQPQPADTPNNPSSSVLEKILSRNPEIQNPEVTAQHLIEQYRSLGGLVAAAQDSKGLDVTLPTTVIEELSVFQEFTLAIVAETIQKRPLMGGFTQVKEYLMAHMRHLIHEEFRVLHLDRKNCLIDTQVFKGTVDHFPAYPREIYRHALAVDASALIIAHNHPSGDPSPSQADIAMTKQLVEVGKAFGIVVHDHLIVGYEAPYSLKSNGHI